MHPLSVLFLCPYPFGVAPSQRFRFEQYFNLLNEKEIKFDQYPFLSDKAWYLMYKDGKYLQKACHLLLAFTQRFILLFRIKKYDYIFIHREATPIGPPILEFVIAKILKKKIIYDFDDAIWLEDSEEKGSLKAWLKCKWKIKKICNWSYKISAGNKYLAGYAGQFNNNVLINPTTIDTDNYHNPSLYEIPNHPPEGLARVWNDELVIGWTGTHSTLQYLQHIIPALKKLEEEFDFIFLVIANKEPDFYLKSLKYIQWNRSTEIEDLLQIDIGVMPLTDDPWSKGKCGFKALQYMALEKPALVSPVGVNKQIVQDGLSGFHCETTEDWESKLRYLIAHSSNRKKMGKKARNFVIENYSVAANEENFLSLFE